MVKGVYSVYDNQAEAFLDPQLYMNDNVARRSFRLMVNNKESLMNHRPDDFTLFKIGEFSSLKGTLLCEKTPKSMGLAREYLEVKKDA